MASKKVNSKFSDVFWKGFYGKNLGIPTGMPKLDVHTGGIIDENYTIIMGGPGTGKTTFLNYTQIIHPYLLWKNKKMPEESKNVSLKWIYFSYEISEVKTMFSFLSYFLKHEFGLIKFFANGAHHQVSPKYLMGQLRCDKTNEFIRVQDDHIKLILKVMEKYMYELFGTDEEEGMIRFIDRSMTPEAMETLIVDHMNEIGEDIYTEVEGIFGPEKKFVRYKKNNEDLKTIILIDHLRKVKGTDDKVKVDSMSNIILELRNRYRLYIVALLHTNREHLGGDNKKFMKEEIYPGARAGKGSGNPLEDCDIFISMFNPNDLEFKLKKHFGLMIRDDNGNIINRNHRTAHILKARWGVTPLHIAMDLNGAQVSIVEKTLPFFN